MPRKPEILLISSVEEMDAFETVDTDDTFSTVVNYFRYIGFTLKEVVNLCMKERLKDSVTISYTWWGRYKKGVRLLYDTRFVVAIYEAIFFNCHFEKLSRSEFRAQVRETLRTAKERLIVILFFVCLDLCTEQRDQQEDDSDQTTLPIIKNYTRKTFLFTKKKQNFTFLRVQ